MNKKSNAQLLKEIEQDILDNMKCPLKDNATNLVFGKGNPNANIIFIGEAPGENEDLEGLPFVGRAGAQLDKLLNTINLGIDDVYIANILKYRPPKNRDPTIDEIKRHTPYLIKQLKTIKPKVVATLGNYSTKFILSGCKPDEMKKIQGIASLHGKPKKLVFNDIEFVVVPIYHPAAMLYRPQLKEDLENDFKTMKKIIDGKLNIERAQKDKSLNES